MDTFQRNFITTMENLPKESPNDGPIIILDDLDDESEASENEIALNESGRINDDEPAVSGRRSADLNDSGATDVLPQREPVNEESRLLDLNDSATTVTLAQREPTRVKWEASNLNDSVATVLFDMRNEINIQKQRTQVNLTAEQKLNALIAADIKAAARPVTPKRISTSADDWSNKENPPKKTCSIARRSWSPKGFNTAINSATRPMQGKRKSDGGCQSYKCGVLGCSFDGQSETNLREHIVESHIDNSYEAFFCQHCNRVFPMVAHIVDNIFGHLRIFHWNVV